MSLHIRLKEATYSLHEETEQLLFPDQPWDTLSVEDYRHFLRIQYVFHCSVETAAGPLLNEPLKQQLRWSQRQKQCRLAADLSELGIRTLPSVALSLSLHSTPEVLGALYVTEGSTLGGRMILRTLQKNAQVAPYTSFRFLEGYGADTGLFWKEFLQILAREAEDKEENNTILAAKQTFGLFVKSVRFIQQEITV